MVHMRSESRKPFDKLWFYANWGAFCVALIVPIVHKFRDPSGPALSRPLGFLGIVLASIATHAIYAGYFAVREAVYTRENEPGVFWLSVIAFGVLSLIFLGIVGA